MLSKTFTHITRIVKLSLTYTALFSSGLAATGPRRGGGGPCNLMQIRVLDSAIASKPVKNQGFVDVDDGN